MNSVLTKKSSAPNKKASTPFFSKGNSESFFTQTDEAQTSFFNDSSIQPKLKIGKPGDEYEQEADSTADMVVEDLHSSNYANNGTSGAPTDFVQSKSDNSEAIEGQEQEVDDSVQMKPVFESSDQKENNTIQRKCDDCESKEETIQQKSEGNASATTIGNKLRASSSGGSALSSNVRTGMEGSFGTDFSNVRIHTGSNAVQMNQELGAQAFTHGNDIYFNQGKYQPDTTSGQHLLAHELTHTVQQGKSVHAKRIQPSWGSFWRGVGRTIVRGGQAVVSGGRSVGRAIVRGGRAVGRAVVSGVRTVGGAVSGLLGRVYTRASSFLGRVGSWAWSGLQSLGGTLLSWLSTAGAHVWRAIRWFGSKAWQALRWLGSFLWEKLSILGENVWSFISNIPSRLWRIIVHGWEGIKGVLGWAWSGLKGAARHLWSAVTGVFSWLGKGIWGALSWLGNGLKGGFLWAVDFIQNPSLSKLWNGLLGTLSWAWDGISSLARWGWDGIVGAAVWAWQGLKGFGSWIWDGIVGGLSWAGKMLMHILDLVGLFERLQILWGLIFRMRKLTSAEIAASKMVHPPGMIPYHLIRVDENSVISMIGGAAVTTFHVIHTPKGGISLDVMVHELTHVAQYENVGSVYMPQAVHAQIMHGRSGGRSSGSAYDYEREGSLANQRAAGRTFKDLNRESQAELVQDYYLCLTSTPPNPCSDHVPFITDMQSGKF